MDSLTPTLNAWQPRVLSVLRIVAALVLLQHPLVKLFGYPMSVNFAPVGSLPWIAGVIEFVTGVMILLGFYTRAAAFLLAGTMAAAYFIGHMPRGVFAIQNGGNLAIMYCFVFFYLIFAGAGPWSLDAQRSSKA
jgi:putative oxidoreductase